MDLHNFKSMSPAVTEPLERTPLLNLNSGYIHRAHKLLPSQGNKSPWRVYQNYILDFKMLRIDKVNDASAVFN